MRRVLDGTSPSVVARPVPVDGDQAIARPAHRFDRGIAELASEVPDVHIHDVRSGIEVEVPHPRHELFPAEDLIRMPHELLEQGRLSPREFHRRSIHGHATSEEIELHVPSPEYRRGTPRGTK